MSWSAHLTVSTAASGERFCAASLPAEAPFVPALPAEAAFFSEAPAPDLPSTIAAASCALPIHSR